MPITCINCGARLGSGARFCTECGRTVPSMNERGSGHERADTGASARTYTPPATFPDGQPVYQKRPPQPPVWEEERPAYRASAQPHDASPAPRRQSAPPDERPDKTSQWAPISLGGYIGLLLLFLIPGVNIIAMLIWALGAGRKRSVHTFARAALLTMLISALLLFLLLFILINYTVVGQLLDLLIMQ